MYKAIVYQHRKISPCVLDVSTDEKEKEAYQILFDAFDHWGAFNYEERIAQKEKQLQKYKSPELVHEDQVFVDFGDKYVKQYTEDEWKEKIEEIERELKTLETKQKMYEGAKSGDQEAIESLVRQESGGPYTSFQTVEVENR